MKNSIIILIGIIIALLIVGGAVALKTMDSSDDQSDDTDASVIDDVTDTVKNATFVADDTSSADEDSDVVSEEVKFNYQNGEGYYREVTYKDGGFRQFDVDTDELIGSSYDSDQDKLPSME